MRIPHAFWIGCLLLLGCSPTEAEPTDPIASLAAEQLSATFDVDYWMSQAQDATPLWHQAIQQCAKPQRPPLPNCHTVRQVRWILRLRESAEQDRGEKGSPTDG